MKGFLNPAQLQYVLFHLAHHVDISRLSRYFRFIRTQDEAESCTGQILFLLSDADVDTNLVVYLNETPVLFPNGSDNSIFLFDDRNNLVFTHDLLKSAFYLLSGYQEYVNTGSKDNLDRFAYSDSIQCKLGFVHKPVVNYYFDFIIRGLKEFGSRNSISIESRRLFHNMGFLLTHDIDKIDLYDAYYLGYKVKEVLGLRKSRLTRGQDIGVLLKGVGQWLGLFKAENPYWNFDFLRKLERDNDFRSVFFFLDQGVRHSDAYYSFEETRVTELFAFLKHENCEIGIHPPVRSLNSTSVMNASRDRLMKASKTDVTGARQHRLLWEHPLTAKIQHDIGLSYDCTLGFAAHEGFRNSYCHPFKLFDFDKNEVIDFWEFPLNVMDGTLFAYRQYSPEVAMKNCEALLDEVVRFGGVFDLLWHNSFFDDQTYPGVTRFYSGLLQKIRDRMPENLLGNELFMKMQQHSGPFRSHDQAEN